MHAHETIRQQHRNRHNYKDIFGKVNCLVRLAVLRQKGKSGFEPEGTFVEGGKEDR